MLWPEWESEREWGHNSHCQNMPWCLQHLGSFLVLWITCVEKAMTDSQISTLKITPNTSRLKTVIRRCQSFNITELQVNRKLVTCDHLLSCDLRLVFQSRNNKPSLWRAAPSTEKGHKSVLCSGKLLFPRWRMKLKMWWHFKIFPKGTQQRRRALLCFSYLLRIEEQKAFKAINQQT